MKPMNEDDYVKSLSRASKWRQLLCVLGFMLISFCVGLTSGIRPLQIHTIAEGEDEVEMEEEQLSWLASAGIISCIPGNTQTILHQNSVMSW